jgi:hypothetical protein
MSQFDYLTPEFRDALRAMADAEAEKKSVKPVQIRVALEGAGLENAEEVIEEKEPGQDIADKT